MSVNEFESRGVPARVKTKVSMAMQVIRGPSGIHGPPGSVEDLGVQSEQVIELDYDSAVSLLGKENADEMFRGVTNG